MPASARAPRPPPSPSPSTPEYGVRWRVIISRQRSTAPRACRVTAGQPPGSSQSQPMIPQPAYGVSTACGTRRAEQEQQPKHPWNVNPTDTQRPRRPWGGDAPTRMAVSRKNGPADGRAVMTMAICVPIGSWRYYVYIYSPVAFAVRHDLSQSAGGPRQLPPAPRLAFPENKKEGNKK